MTPRTSPTFRRRELARRIRRLREQSGLTQGAAASGLDMSKSALSRKETGDAATSVHEVRSMMDLYDHYDPELIELARAAKQKGWWRNYGVSDHGYVDLETEAVSVRETQLCVVPGLLQTGEYMRNLFEAVDPTHSAEVIERAAKLRQERQRRLTQLDHLLRLHVVITENVLRCPVGGRGVLARQLRAIVECGSLPNVIVQVLPQGSSACAAVHSSFALLSYADPEQKDVFYVEHVGGSLHSERDLEVRAAKLVFDDVCDRALSHEDSLRFVERVAVELEGGRYVGGAPPEAPLAQEQS